MNIYARDVFDSHRIALGEAFAAPTAVSVANAPVLAQAQRLISQSQDALTSRANIDQAIGILISRTGGTAAEAFTRLQSISQSQHVRLADVARQILQDAARRARRRDTGPDGEGATT